MDFNTDELNVEGLACQMDLKEYLDNLKAENEELKEKSYIDAVSGKIYRFSDLIKCQQKLEKIKEVHQWILDQWELDTKEVQDKILQIIEDMS